MKAHRLSSLSQNLGGSLGLEAGEGGTWGPPLMRPLPLVVSLLTEGVLLGSPLRQRRCHWLVPHEMYMILRRGNNYFMNWRGS